MTILLIVSRARAGGPGPGRSGGGRRPAAAGALVPCKPAFPDVEDFAAAEQSQLMAVGLETGAGGDDDPPDGDGDGFDFGAEDGDEEAGDDDPPCPPDIIDKVGRGRQVGAWIKCAYNCGPPRRQKWFRRSNPQRGFFLCIECTAAARCLKGQCKTPEAKLSLKEYLVKDPEGWAARVRACRIDPKRGLVVDLRSRMVEVLKHVTAMTQRIIMRDIAGVEWLDRVEWQQETGAAP